VVHKSAPTQRKDLQPRPTYAGNNSKQPSLRELIEEHARINDNFSKKLVTNDKILEDINAKMDSFSAVLKDQVAFNARLESNLSKLSTAMSVATNPERVFNIRTRGGKQITDHHIRRAQQDVDGVFWYTKHVHYTLVWICLWN
jgi:hypothetical protein